MWSTEEGKAIEREFCGVTLAFKDLDAALLHKEHKEKFVHHDPCVKGQCPVPNCKNEHESWLMTIGKTMYRREIWVENRARFGMDEPARIEDISSWGFLWVCAKTDKVRGNDE